MATLVEKLAQIIDRIGADHFAMKAKVDLIPRPDSIDGSAGKFVATDGERYILVPAPEGGDGTPEILRVPYVNGDYATELDAAPNSSLIIATEDGNVFLKTPAGEMDLIPTTASLNSVFEYIIDSKQDKLPDPVGAGKFLAVGDDAYVLVDPPSGGGGGGSSSGGQLVASLPDTGWRDITAEVVAGFGPSNMVMDSGATWRVRRVGTTVEIVAGSFTVPDSGWHGWYGFPQEFAPDVDTGFEHYDGLLAPRTVGTPRISVYPDAVIVNYESMQTSGTHRLHAIYETSRPWPTSLPGTAITPAKASAADVNRLGSFDPGRWYNIGGGVANALGYNPGVYFWPIEIPTDFPIQSLGFGTYNDGGSTVRFAFYTLSGMTLTKVTSDASVVIQGTNFYTVPISGTLPAGWVWLCMSTSYYPTLTAFYQEFHKGLVPTGNVGDTAGNQLSSKGVASSSTAAGTTPDIVTLTHSHDASLPFLSIRAS